MKNAMRARPVLLAQNDVKRDQCVEGAVCCAALLLDCFVQKASMNTIAKINDADEQTPARRESPRENP